MKKSLLEVLKEALISGIHAPLGRYLIMVAVLAITIALFYPETAVYFNGLSGIGTFAFPLFFLGLLNYPAFNETMFALKRLHEGELSKYPLSAFGNALMYFALLAFCLYTMTDVSITQWNELPITSLRDAGAKMFAFLVTVTVISGAYLVGMAEYQHDQWMKM